MAIMKNKPRSVRAGDLRVASFALTQFLSLALLFGQPPQPPTLTSVSPRMDFTSTTFPVTLTGTGLNGANPKLVYDPPGMITDANYKATADCGSATVNFTLTSAASGVVNIGLRTDNG